MTPVLKMPDTVILCYGFEVGGCVAVVSLLFD